MSERQTATTLATVQADHIGRYVFAAEEERGFMSPVLDLGCGCGYGSWILADTGYGVLGIDKDPEAIAFACEHWYHERTSYLVLDVDGFKDHFISCGGATLFEIIEHLSDPATMLRSLREACPRIVMSVPNANVVPFERARFPYHKRHYTEVELDELLRSVGFTPTAWWTQYERSLKTVVPGTRGRTIVVEASR